MRDIDGRYRSLLENAHGAFSLSSPLGERRCRCCGKPAPLLYCLSCADAVAAIMRAFDLGDAGAAKLLSAILADPDAREAWAQRGRRRA